MENLKISGERFGAIGEGNRISTVARGNVPPPPRVNQIMKHVVLFILTWPSLKTFVRRPKLILLIGNEKYMKLVLFPAQNEQRKIQL